jgi:hypothetical protein
MDATKPYEFIGFGAMDATKPYKFIVFVWPSGFLEAWGTKAKTRHMFKKLLVFWPRRRRRQGQQTTLFRKMFGLLAWCPKASKNSLGQNKKHFGIPLRFRRWPGYNKSVFTVRRLAPCPGPLREPPHEGNPLHFWVRGGALGEGANLTPTSH